MEEEKKEKVVKPRRPYHRNVKSKENKKQNEEGKSKKK